MKAVATLLLSAALATTATADQKVLKQPGPSEPSHADLLSKIEDGMKTLGTEAHQIFEDISALLPESLDHMTFQAPPKPHQRKHDSEWDYITKGADIQALWTTNEAGEQEREIEGKLESFTLRTKKVDPKSLGADNVTQYSGYLDDEDEDKHLFYWFFESRNDPKNDPVVLWLNGGPGCSSLTGLFLELGPSFVTKKLSLDYNPYSWNANASVIFLDQPVNVGYSYSGGSVGTTEAASKDVYALLTLFFKRFPQYAKQDFHIAGESYAGHYIPSFANEILSHKKRNINLKSVLIGNGLTDGLTQYKYYKPMACGEGGWPAVVDESTCKTMDDAYPQCASLIQSCYDSESVWMCVPAAVYCNSALLAPYQQTGANVYDVRGPCEDPDNLCYPQLGWIQEYLNKDHVKEALGAEVSNYESCNMGINQNFLFHGDWMLPFHRLVPDLLAKIGVLVYAGDADFICNWLGNLAWTEALEWPGQKDYNKAKMEDLTLLNSKHKTGSVKSSGNFTFIRLHAGGHMVPHDQPEASADMFNRWIGGEWLKGL